MPTGNVIFHRLAAREYRSARDWCAARSTQPYMTIQLTDEQWANIEKGGLPVRVSDPARSATFVLARAEVYERFKCQSCCNLTTCGNRQARLALLCSTEQIHQEEFCAATVNRRRRSGGPRGAEQLAPQPRDGQPARATSPAGWPRASRAAARGPEPRRARNRSAMRSLLQFLEVAGQGLAPGMGLQPGVVSGAHADLRAVLR